MQSCYFHSSKEAKYTCIDCNKKICSSCVILVEGMPYCQLCWDHYVAPLRHHREIEEANLQVPWQRWQEIGLIKAFWLTFRQISFQPNQFFSKVPLKSDFTTPLFFALICTMLFWFPPNLIYIQYLLPLWLEISNDLALQANDTLVNNEQSLNKLNESLTGYQMFMLPLNYLFVEIILIAWLQQSLVSLFRGKAGFPATFQIRCYAMAVQVLNFIPLFGLFLAQIGSILICMRGFYIVQQITKRQAFIVAVAPVLFSFMLVMFASIL